jgi:hypothetical protein
MRKFLIISIAITQSIILFSQNKKHIYYNNGSNNDLKQISENQYLSLQNNTSYPLTYENDSLKISCLIKIKIVGKLNEEAIDYFKKNYDLDKNNFTVINYSRYAKRFSKSIVLTFSLLETYIS